MHVHENEFVKPPRGTRKVAGIGTVLIILVPLILATAPWIQNVPSQGRVVAFDPVDRLQVLPAPVTGRVVTVHVREGSRVEAGDPLVEMADLDPLYAMRLDQQAVFAQSKVDALTDSLAFYDQQVELLTESRELAVRIAEYELEMSHQKVILEEQGLVAAIANRDQKLPDAERRERLREKLLVSTLDYQKADAALKEAEAKAQAAEAKVKEAKSGVKAMTVNVTMVKNELQAKLESIRSDREDTRAKVALAEKELTDSITKQERQRTQLVKAPRAGTVIRVSAANRAELINAGEPLIEFLPASDHLAVELWLDGNDAPLVTPGRKIRLQFEGWPAVQFVGWPSVAIGTFPGVVSLVDSHDDGAGRFRMLVEPDKDAAPWPEQPYLRQGARAKGWVLLDQVSLGFEIWRRLNGFPPSLGQAPNAKQSTK